MQQAATCCPALSMTIVHFRDPGLTHKADILTESRAAAAGGVTSIMDMPNTNPLTVTLDALNAKLDLLNEKCIVNHSCYFGATNNNYTEFEQAGQTPRLRHQAVHGLQVPVICWWIK